MDDIPHIAWPIRFGSGSYQTCQQDTEEELASNVAVIVGFERGSRIEAIDYGITDPTFQAMPVDTAEIESQVGYYEPRAVLTVTLSEGEGSQRVDLGVRLATNPED